MRLCIPVTQHFGLGNELMPIAKSFCAAQECGLRLTCPQWARADRKYHHERYFPAPWRDRLLTRFGRLQRCVTFSEADYRATGVVDYGQAARAFLEFKGLTTGPLTFYTEGMWGGFASIVNSRPYIRSLLLQMPFTLSNCQAVLRRLDPAKLTVAVHVRSGTSRRRAGRNGSPARGTRACRWNGTSRSAAQWRRHSDRARSSSFARTARRRSATGSSAGSSRFTRSAVR